MKNIICCFIILFGFTSYSQQTISFLLYSDYVKPYHFTVGFTPKNINENTYSLSIYNPIMQVNDNYIGVEGNYYMSNVKTLSIYRYEGVPADSFNPYGSTTMKGALVNGAIGFLGLGDLFGYTPYK